MYSQVMNEAQEKSGLVIDDITIKINREEEEETYGRGKQVYQSHTCVMPGSWKYRECDYRFALMKMLSLKINEKE